jgi:hypothetical protein
MVRHSPCLDDVVTLDLTLLRLQRDHNAESSGYWKLGLSNPYARTSGLSYETKGKAQMQAEV